MKVINGDEIDPMDKTIVIEFTGRELLAVWAFLGYGSTTDAANGTLNVYNLELDSYLPLWDEVGEALDLLGFEKI